MTNPIDLDAVRAAVQRLNELARNHPELCQGEPWANHLDTLEELTMARKPGAVRQREWRARRIAAGQREYRVWLDPADADRLETLLQARGYEPGTRQEGISTLVAEALGLLTQPPARSK